MIEPDYKNPFNKSCESTIEKILRDVEKWEEVYLKVIEFLKNENERLKKENEKLKAKRKEVREISKNLIDLTDKALDEKINKEGLECWLKVCREYFEEFFRKI